jgi:hypothetical protein
MRNAETAKLRLMRGLMEMMDLINLIALKRPCSDSSPG